MALVPEGDPNREAERLAGLLDLQIEDAGLPAPTYIIATGGGLCAKLLFDTAIPSTSRPRWQSLQRQIVQKVGEIEGRFGDRAWRWPVDYQACYAARVLRLVGSHNPRWDAACTIVWDHGKPRDFEQLADELPKYHC
ncbi:MAG: hypothetical protein ABI224_11220 [Acetobacteraceae bacterium]